MITKPLPTPEELKRLKPFAMMSEEELRNICNLMERAHFEAGETLINESQPADCFFILISGRLRVFKTLDNGEQETLSVVSEPGELFGEMSLVEDKPRSAAVSTLEPSDVLTVSKDGFLNLVDRFPQFTLVVARNISNYLRKTDQTLIRTLEERNAELARTVKELEETRAELVSKERLSMLGRMSATVIHDLKSPLTTISGFAQLLRLQDLDKTEIVKYADNINRQVEQFMAMTQEILTYARGGAEATLVEMDLMPMLQDILMGIAFPLIQKKMKLETDLNFMGRVRVDRDRFPRIIENLASNAIDAMEPGGVLSVRTEACDGGVNILVSDTGHGIDPEIQDRIFEEFFTHGKHKGTGLGLSIVHSIVAEHGGHISVDSQPGIGTTFTLFLPQV